MLELIKYASENEITRGQTDFVIQGVHQGGKPNCAPIAVAKVYLHEIGSVELSSHMGLVVQDNHVNLAGFERKITRDELNEICEFLNHGRASDAQDDKAYEALIVLVHVAIALIIKPDMDSLLDDVESVSMGFNSFDMEEKFRRHFQLDDAVTYTKHNASIRALRRLRRVRDASCAANGKNHVFFVHNGIADAHGKRKRIKRASRLRYNVGSFFAIRKTPEG